ncbi:hypothetical protein EAF00_010586 [Botryotinia globosa]|nr:hypothetical protein EAF00_010586 [Botryotinia globosa]
MQGRAQPSNNVPDYIELNSETRNKQIERIRIAGRNRGSTLTYNENATGRREENAKAKDVARGPRLAC